jgi:hypothetical protein
VSRVAACSVAVVAAGAEALKLCSFCTFLSGQRAMPPGQGVRVMNKTQSDRQRSAQPQESIYNMGPQGQPQGFNFAPTVVRNHPAAAAGPPSPTGAGPKRRMHADSSQVRPAAAHSC